VKGELRFRRALQNRWVRVRTKRCRTPARCPRRRLRPSTVAHVGWHDIIGPGLCCRRPCSPGDASVSRHCSRTSYRMPTLEAGCRSWAFGVCRSGSRRASPSWFRVAVARNVHSIRAVSLGSARYPDMATRSVMPFEPVCSCE